jgi:hypothetical protein
VSGTVDAGYVNTWLTDGRPSFPVRRTGTLSLTVTPSAAKMVDVIALNHHNVRAAATVTLGGSLSSTIPTVAEPPDAIFPNIYRLLTTPVSVSSLVLGISGNTVPVITSLYAGPSHTITPLRLGRVRDPSVTFEWEGEMLTQAPYDPGISDPRRWRGDCVIDETELQEVEDWYLSTRRGTRPTLIIPDDNYNDAPLAVFRYNAVDLAPGAYPVGSPFTEPEALFQVTFEFVEIPRLRWP